MPFLDSDSPIEGLGATFRRTRPGPELDLVDTFLQAIPLQIPRGCRATVFREPRLESGFPDLVIVVWRETTARGWKRDRAFLEPGDLRVAHFLHHARRADDEKLTSVFGRGVLSRLERLRHAELIRSVGQAWAPRSLRKSFAASKIIAIEAKVGKWGEVLGQAALNTWFASKSYVLVPNLPSLPQLHTAQEMGIGVCSLQGSKVTEVASDSSRLPRSYASWLLNEWAWRSATDAQDRAL